MDREGESARTVPKMKDYHVSEEFGFLLPEPLVVLPEYFEPWNNLGRNLVELLKDHKLRAAVHEMPLLDDGSLSGYRQLRLAHLLLCFIGNGYIWQDGDKNAPKKLPRQLAIPWYSVSGRLGLKPVICHASMILSNYTFINRSKPLSLENMKPICRFSGGESCEWFFLVVIQIELDAAKGIQALVQAMEAVLEDVSATVCSSLSIIANSIQTMKRTLSLMHERMVADDFYFTVLPFLSGWGTPGSPISEGIIFEGVSETPICVLGSVAQSTTIQCFDVGLGIGHGQQYMAKIRNYMPPRHAEFVTALAEGPSIKDYVATSGNEDLKAAYRNCVAAMRDFRSYHLQIVAKYVVVPSHRNNSGDAKEKETEGTDLIPFLKGMRDTTNTDSRI